MKLIILNKKKIFILGLILILLFGACIIQNNSFILTSNTIIGDEFINKINSLLSGREKVAYLTFDDGPNQTITPKVLDILKKENVKATFFVIGKHVEKYPDLVKRAYEEGHYIANHGYDHNNKILYKSKESFINEIIKTDKAIGKAIGKENYSARVFRFPNGYMAPLYKEQKKMATSLLKSIGYTYIDWNCLNNDSMKKYTNEQLLNNLIESSKNKNTLVILMHDTKDVSNSSLVLEDSIKYLKSQGYVFKNFYNLTN